MQRTYHMSGHTIGLTQDERAVTPSSNHFRQANLTPKLASQIHELGLRRVAGNIFECPSAKDFWQVKGGKLMRLSLTEVDNNEHLAAATPDDPRSFLNQALADLTW